MTITVVTVPKIKVHQVNWNQKVTVSDEVINTDFTQEPGSLWTTSFHV